MILLLAVVLTIEPSPATGCENGLARVRLSWREAGPGRVQVRVGSVAGSAMTGWEAGEGSAETGVWVKNGMLFFLVNEQGQEMVRAAARVACEDYWPLEIGNRWVYRQDSRWATAAYATWSVTGQREEGGRTWAVLDHAGEEWLLRTDERQRIWRWTEGREVLLLDPAAEPKSSLDHPLGPFPDVVAYQRMEPLRVERGAYALGVGLVEMRADMLSGSSGGFLEGQTLVEARVNGRVLALRGPQIRLGAESTRLDVSGKKVRNCAVPCYFVACYLAPGADPPDTWKPCFEARVESDEPAEIAFEDPAGRRLFEAQLPAGVRFQSIPLYFQPNIAFPPGGYRLAVRTPGGAMSSLPVVIE
jgi:hypothetical protein